MRFSRWCTGWVVLLFWACSSGGGSSGSATGGTAGTAAGGAGGAGGASGASTGGTGGLGATGGVAGGGGQAGDAASDQTSDGGGDPIIEMDTSLGKMVFQLDPTNMPITTANFLEYVDAGFFTDTIIHRVIPNFVIQGGGFTSGLQPKSTNLPIVLETSPLIVHDYGVISMARTNNPDSATSQFFVVNGQAGAHSLDGKYAAFGHLLEGAAALDAISAVPTSSQSGFDDVPVTDVVVKSVVRKN